MTKKNKENKVDSSTIDSLEVGDIATTDEGLDLQITSIIAEDEFTANIIKEVKYKALENHYISSNHHNFTFKKDEIYPLSILQNKFGAETFDYMMKCTNLKNSLVEEK